MTFDQTNTVRGSDLRRLLESTLPDPVLVLLAGRTDVVSGDEEHAGLEIISRETFLRDTGSADLTDAELEQHAANLAAGVANLGG
jgi:hypothetical protein